MKLFSKKQINQSKRDQEEFKILRNIELIKQETEALKQKNLEISKYENNKPELIKEYEAFINKVNKIKSNLFMDIQKLRDEKDNLLKYIANNK